VAKRERRGRGVGRKQGDRDRRGDKTKMATATRGFKTSSNYRGTFISEKVRKRSHSVGVWGNYREEEHSIGFV